MVYVNNIDNQHSSMRKFTKRWFEPYVVTSANDNDTYHLAELDGTRLAVPIAGKRVNIFKKRHNYEPNLDDLEEDESDQVLGHEVNEEEENDDWPPSAHHSWHIAEDVRFGGGGCRDVAYWVREMHMNEGKRIKCTHQAKT